MLYLLYMGVRKWTKESLIEDARKFGTVKEWRRNSKAAVHAAERKLLYKEIREILTPTRKTWDFESVKEDALKYQTKSEWYDNSGSAVQWAKRNKKYAKVTAHMDISHKTWTKESILAEALKYNTVRDWRRESNDSYSAANWHKITKEASQHMIRLQGFWTQERMLIEARKWTTIKEWKENAHGCYLTALRVSYDFAKECTSHMDKDRSISQQEHEIFSIIQSLFPSTKKLRLKAKKTETLFKRFELDIFIPELNKGIEFDGKYWHSFECMRQQKHRQNWTDEQIHSYHEIKDAFFLEHGIQVIHIKEQDWKTGRQNCLDKIWKFLEN